MSARLLHAPATRLSALLVALAVLTGCAGPTFSSLPLPGSGVSGSTIKVTADFAEALNLAQGAAVRVNGVDSGRVSDVAVKDFHAVVTMNVRTNAKLRSDATARLRYTTPLGELYVDVTNPSKGPLAADGTHLGEKQTTTAPTVEDALSAASMLINGGGLNQLQTIVTESNKALGGREGTVRDLLTRSQGLLTQINSSSADFDKALRAMNGAAAALQGRRKIIHQALVDVRPASAALRANTENFTALLTSLNKFASQANGVVRASRTQILRLVRQAQPLLQEMVSTIPTFPKTLKALLHLRDILDNVVPGDYLNLGSHLRLDSFVLGGKTVGLDTLLGLLGLGGKTKGNTKAKGKPKGLNGIGKNTAAGVTQGIVGGLLNGLLGSSKDTKSPTGKGTNSLAGLLNGLLGGSK